MSRLFAFFAAFLFGFALAFASAAWGVFQINDPKHGALFVWTADEMDKLESALQDLVAERDALRRRVAEFKRTCT